MSNSTWPCQNCKGQVYLNDVNNGQEFLHLLETGCRKPAVKLRAVHPATRKPGKSSKGNPTNPALAS